MCACLDRSRNSLSPQGRPPSRADRSGISLAPHSLRSQCRSTNCGTILVAALSAAVSERAGLPAARGRHKRSEEDGPAVVPLARRQRPATLLLNSAQVRMQMFHSILAKVPSRAEEGSDAAYPDAAGSVHGSSAGRPAGPVEAGSLHSRPLQ